MNQPPEKNQNPTDTTPAPQPDAPAPEVGEQQPDSAVEVPANDEGQKSDTAKLVAEAKRYRKRAQDAEEAHEELRGKYLKLIRSVAERHIHGRSTGNVLWGAGTKPEDLLDDTGRLDFSKVDAAERQARKHFGLNTAEDPNLGRAGATYGEIDWSDVLNQK